MLKYSNTSSNTLQTASLFGMHISFGDTFKIEEDKVTIPQGLKACDPNTILGSALIFKGIALNNEDDITIEPDFLSLFEKEQILFISRLLFGAKQIEQKYMLSSQVPIYTQAFIIFLSQKIGGSKLNIFLSEVLEKEDEFKNINSLYELYSLLVKKYISVKSIQDSPEDSNTTGGEDSNNDGKEENNELLQQDIEFGEQKEGEDSGVFCTFEPKLRGQFLFRSSIFSDWSHKKNLFQKNEANIKNEIFPTLGSDVVSTMEYTAGNKGTSYSIVLPKNHSIVNFDTEKIRIFKDSYGCYTLEVLIPGEQSIEIGKTSNIHDFSDEDSHLPIYTGYKIPNLGDNPFQILNWIKTNKNYNEKNQKKIKDISSDSNDYMENIYKEDEIECMTANMFFVVLCRRLGYPARMIGGVSGYHKKNTTYLSHNRGHAWSEVYIDGEWIELDATPAKKRKEGEGDGESSTKREGESIEEMISNMGNDEESDLDGEVPENEQYNQVNHGDAIELEDTKRGVHELLALTEGLDDITKSAIEFVYQDAKEIIDVIESVMQSRKESQARQRIGAQQKKRRGGLSDGEFHVNPQTLVDLSVGNPHIYSKNNKLTPHPEGDIDTKITKGVISIDISGSMGPLQGKWDTPQKMDSAYLSIVLLVLIYKALNIDLDVVLFSDKSFVIKNKFLKNGNINPKFFQEIQETMSNKCGGNQANASGIRDGLDLLIGEIKGLLTILSDGDGNTNAFFTENGESKRILRNHQNITVTGYGLGEDACCPQGMIRGKNLSVIESQMYLGEGINSKGYNVVEYKMVLKHLKDHLSALMTQKKVKLT